MASWPSLQGEMSCSDTTALTRCLLFLGLLHNNISTDIGTITLLVSRLFRASQTSFTSSALAIFSQKLTVLSFGTWWWSFRIRRVPEVQTGQTDAACHARAQFYSISFGTALFLFFHFFFRSFFRLITPPYICIFAMSIFFLPRKKTQLPSKITTPFFCRYSRIFGSFFSISSTFFFIGILFFHQNIKIFIFSSIFNSHW